MNPFNDPIGDSTRDLYGAYQKRWSALKTAGQSGGIPVWADGTNWVDWQPTPANALQPTIFEHSIYQVQIVLNGGWVGNPAYRIILDDYDTVIYPFEGKEFVNSGVWVYLGTLSSRLRVGDRAILQVHSYNAGDQGPAQTFTAQIRYTIWDER